MTRDVIFASVSTSAILVITPISSVCFFFLFFFCFFLGGGGGEGAFFLHNTKVLVIIRCSFTFFT